MLVAIRPVARFLVPILLVAYLAPFVAGPDQVRACCAVPAADGRPVRTADEGRDATRPPGDDVTGTVALHGGGEFLPGDEPFLEAILRRGRAHGPTDRARRRRPTAAARGRPSWPPANGATAFERVARSPAGVGAGGGRVGRRRRRRPIALVRLAAGRPHPPARRRSGPDPRAPPAARRVGGHQRRPTTAGRSRRCERRGDGLAGLDVDAGRGRGGLGLVPGSLVVPHAEPASGDSLARFGRRSPTDLGALGLAERTGSSAGPAGRGASSARARPLAPAGDGPSADRGRRRRAAVRSQPTPAGDG